MWLFLWYLWCFASDVSSILDTPNIPYDALIDENDLNIGALYSVRDRSSDLYSPCGGPIKNARLQQNIQAVVYAVNKINQDNPVHR